MQSITGDETRGMLGRIGRYDERGICGGGEKSPSLSLIESEIGREVGRITMINGGFMSQEHICEPSVVTSY